MYLYINMCTCIFIYLFIHLFRVYPYQRSHQGVPPIVTPRPPPPGPNMTDCTHPLGAGPSENNSKSPPPPMGPNMTDCTQPLGAGPSNNVIPLQQFSHLLNKMSQMMMMMMMKMMTSRQR